MGGPAFLDRLDPAAVRRLEELGTSRRYPARSFVMTEGERPGSVLVIRDGLLKVTKASPGGRPVLLALRGRGELVGELSALDQRGRSASVSTVVTSDLIVLRGSVFAEAVREDTALANALLDVLTGRVREMSKQVVELATGDAMARVCGRLLELVDDDHAEGPVEVRLPISQEELGAWAGLSREAVVKALRRLRDLGWIHTDRRSLTIVDITALRNRSAQVPV